ncbi:hypothetical protein [Flexivirga lutea]
MAADDFDTTVEQLYGGPAEEFIARRDAATKSARTAGDKELAKRIKALRRPTTAAELVNRLHRDDGESLEELLDLGEKLREAQSALDAKAMKSLSGERNSLITRLVKQIADAADEPVSTAVREQLSDTFTAAVADADAAHAVSSGRLVTGLRYSGFGEMDLRDAVATPLRKPAAAQSTDTADTEATDTEATDTDDTAAAAEAAERERRAAQHALSEAGDALAAARRAERAALESADLADRALAAARRTAQSARSRAEAATAARTDAEEAVSAAEKAAADTTSDE